MNEQPSILFISLMNGAAWGGSEELWFKTAMYASAKKYRIGCVLFEWPEKESQVTKLITSGCSVYRLPNAGRLRSDLKEKWIYKTITKIRLKHAVKKLPVDEYDIVVISQGGDRDVYSKPWKQFYKKLKRYQLIYHNYDEQFSFKKRKLGILKDWISGAKKNFFVSKRMKDVLEKQLNITFPNPELVINPITFIQPSVPSPFPPLENGNFVFAMLATLDVRRKAQDNLIHVLSSEKWKSRNWILDLYGDGLSSSLLKNLVAEKNAGDKIFLRGYVNDVKNVLLKTHLVMQITHIDAMPLTVVEAMAMAKPVVVSNIGDMPDWVQENINGWIAPDASIENIDKVLEVAWSKRNDWNEMGRSSYDLFMKKFPVCIEEKFLRQIINSNPKKI